MNNLKGLPVKVGIGLDNSILQHSSSAGNFFYMEYPKNELADPKWQKVRLKTFERDAFTCLLCGDQETQLECHHKQYVFGRELWDYTEDNFMTLCHHCHKVHKYTGKWHEHILYTVKTKFDNFITLFVFMSEGTVLRYCYDLELKRFEEGFVYQMQMKEIDNLLNRIGNAG